jgi:hypothetical protein
VINHASPASGFIALVPLKASGVCFQPGGFESMDRAREKKTRCGRSIKVGAV